MRWPTGLINEYFREMNIPVSLLDLMNSVQPGDVKWLTQSENDLYFPHFDPVFLDKVFSQRAAEKGISKVEFIRREQRLRTECTLTSGNEQDIKRYSDCIEDIKNGTR